MDSKKIKSIILISLIGLMLAACGSTPEASSDPAAPNTANSSENDAPANTATTEENSDGENDSSSEAPIEGQGSGEAPQLSATVTHSNYSISEQGYFSIFGIVENTDTVPMEFIQAVVTVMDNAGTTVVEDFSYTFLDVLQPSMTTPFNMTFLQVPENWSYYQISILSAPNDFMQTLTQFDILSNTGNPGSFGNYEISGEIQNNGEVPAQYVEISAAVFDAAGIILGVGFGYADVDVIEPQGTSSFSLSIPYLAEGEVASYQLWVEANLQE